MFRTHIHHRPTSSPGRQGSHGPLRDAAKATDDFHAEVIAYATGFDNAGLTLPRCFKCKKGAVEAELAQDDALVWHCPRCQVEATAAGNGAMKIASHSRQRSCCTQ